MKAPAFDYARPTTLEEALTLRAAGGDDAKFLAGGQSLGPLLNLRLARPSLLIDVRRLPELAGWSIEGDWVRIGAAVTHAAIEDGVLPGPLGRFLASVAHGIGYRAIRNRGTLGGSLAHADPAADWVSVMALLAAEVDVRSASRARRVAAADLVDGPLSTVLDPDELIVSVRVPQGSDSARWSYRKFNRKPGKFAEAIGGFHIDPERGAMSRRGGCDRRRADRDCPGRRPARLGYGLRNGDRQCRIRPGDLRTSGPRRDVAPREAGDFGGSGMKSITMEVNGEQVSTTVRPRTHLADLLREELRLTGTHLGCEHGVCGACTLEIDGAPARSCIALAVACDGARIRTVEGFDDDPVMQSLRSAFNEHHALQCGYCTPGMLITARDIVLRLPDADEARIREELAGNLCRCTGYVGIVRAIASVIVARRGNT